MRPRAAAPTLRRKPTPVRAPTGPTAEQCLALDAAMRAAAKGDLWQYSLSAATVICERKQGVKIVARIVYDNAEVAQLGARWPAEVMARLSDPWTEQFTRGIT